MKPLVSIIMGSTSDMKVMEDAVNFLEDMEVPFEINALSAHRTPELVAEYAETAHQRGVKVIIAAAGGAAHLPGVCAASTSLPVIGVPINSSNSIKGVDSLLSIVQMPSGIPVATVGIDNAKNAAILALQILAVADEKLFEKNLKFKNELKDKVTKANQELSKLEYKFLVK
ncbi:MAG: 5-(carboxyamino)imidazole ribonucleotide mutase [Bacteroidales bacterium]|nr:5-(carboxyamino)imidazole ribonucleotide mutase [Bacteroidales bacterium]